MMVWKSKNTTEDNFIHQSTVSITNYRAHIYNNLLAANNKNTNKIGN